MKAGLLPITQAVACTLALLLPFTASAVELGDNLSVTGFFSLQGIYTDKAGASVPRPQGEASDLEADKFDFDSSVLGARADLDLFDGLGASLQVISTKQTEDSYDPEVEWAYLKYDFDNDVSVRVGQMKVPFLQGTELRYVGHSRQWAWPVVPINGAGGFDVLRGAEIYYSTYYDDYDILLHASLGEPDHGLDFIKDTWAGLVSAELDSGAGKLRASYMQAGFDIYSEDNQLLYANTTLRMGSLEGEYEWNNWITHGGMATGTAYKHPDEYLAYFSLGYRFDRFTPFALFSRKEMRFESLAFFEEEDSDLLTGGSGEGVDPGPPGEPPPPPPPDFVEQDQDGKRIDDTFAIGVRYDLTPRLAMKFQWDYLKSSSKAVVGEPDQAHKFNIYTFVIEGVF